MKIYRLIGTAICIAAMAIPYGIGLSLATSAVSHAFGAIIALFAAVGMIGAPWVVYRDINELLGRKTDKTSNPTGE